MKFGFVDGHRQVWPVRVMCALLGLLASGFVTLGVPYAAGSSTSEADRLARQRVLNDDICARHGLLPETGS